MSKSQLRTDKISAKDAMAAFEQYTNHAHRGGPRPQLIRPKDNNDPDILVLSFMVQADEELTQLREAVRVLGRHAREVAWQVTDEGDDVMSNVAQYVRDNPIAAAAVRGEKESKHGT